MHRYRDRAGVSLSMSLSLSVIGVNTSTHVCIQESIHSIPESLCAVEAAEESASIHDAEEYTQVRLMTC